MLPINTSRSPDAHRYMKCFELITNLLRRLISIPETWLGSQVALEVRRDEFGGPLMVTSSQKDLAVAQVLVVDQHGDPKFQR